MDKEKIISIAVISISVLLFVGTLLFSFRDISISSLLESTGVDEVITPIKEAGTLADKLKDEIPTIQEELQKEMNEDGITLSLCGTVTKIDDCSTFVLNIKGKDTRFKLIGISILEEKKEQGLLALQEKIKVDDVLFVEYDAVPADEYGRTLAYLYTESGEMIQKWLIENGYAVYVSDGVNTTYEAELKQITAKE